MSPNQSTHSQSQIESRRRWLKLGTCGAMSNLTFLSTLLHLKMTNAVMAAPTVPPTGGYKAMVCLFFEGGCDSFNFLTPYGTTQADTQYADYVATRTGAAMKRTAAWDGAWTGTDYGYLNPIVDSSSAGGTGRTFGLHPRFTNLKQIYDAGHASFVANVGPLVVPLANNADFNNAAKLKPIELYSHSDQQHHWQTAVPTSRDQLKGWAGRMADLLTDRASTAVASNVYTAISTNGQSLLLTGNSISPYTISNNGAVLLQGYGGIGNALDRIFTTVQTNLASQTYTDLLEKTIRNQRVAARDAVAAYQGAFSTTTLPTTGVQFPTDYVGANLAAVAKSIKIAQSATAPLHQERQVYVVEAYGWDQHSNLLDGMNDLVPRVDLAMKAFYDFLIAENLLDRVTLFSISDFGRTWTFNGGGSDHGWGGNAMVMGGAVNGLPGNNRLWGTYPEIISTGTGTTGIDRGRGVIIPQVSTDVYHAEICRWFGIGNDSNLELILPNIRNFHASGATGHPVGFLKYT